MTVHRDLRLVPTSATSAATGKPASLDRDDDIADLRAQRDAALGALAAWSARDWAEPAGGYQRGADRREAEDRYAAHWWAAITTGHDQDDEVDGWRLISCRQERGERA